MSSVAPRETMAIMVGAGLVTIGYLIGYLGVKWYNNADQPQRQVVLPRPLETRRRHPSSLETILFTSGTPTDHTEN
jgi:hypothetical protein